MAKWGEGDPRWIVEQRADSHNVNNWHWKEVGEYQKNLNIFKTIENSNRVYIRYL